jgi:hypothetical protein
MMVMPVTVRPVDPVHGTTLAVFRHCVKEASRGQIQKNTKEFDKTVKQINNRSRKIFGCRSSHEVFLDRKIALHI